VLVLQALEDLCGEIGIRRRLLVAEPAKRLECREEGAVERRALLAAGQMTRHSPAAIAGELSLGEGRQRASGLAVRSVHCEEENAHERLDAQAPGNAAA
jgi:hypothetical protein